MESQSQKIISILSLCDLRACERYRSYLEKILLQLNRLHELHKIAEEILKIYGGMDSFNDTGIYKDFNLLRDEDIKFDNLSDELFLACKEAIAADS